MINGLTLKFSFDDGGEEDLRVAVLLEKYGFTGTFFIPNQTELTREEILKISEKHKVGGHTVNHPPDLKILDEDILDYEISENRKWLQELTGQEVDEFCYTRGRYDDRVIEAVKRAGFTSARTTTISWHFGEPKDPFKTPTTVHMYDRREYLGMPWQEYAEIMLEKALHAAKKFGNGHFHLWGHSWELTKFNYWDDFENILIKIHEDISGK